MKKAIWERRVILKDSGRFKPEGRVM